MHVYIFAHLFAWYMWPLTLGYCGHQYLQSDGDDLTSPMTVLKSHKAAPIVVKELAGDMRGLLGLSASWDF